MRRENDNVIKLFLSISLVFLAIIVLSFYVGTTKLNESEPIKQKNIFRPMQRKVIKEFVQQDGAPKAQERPKKHPYNGTGALLVIHVHSSEPTMGRLQTLKNIWGSHPLIQSGKILIEIILPKKPNNELAFPVVHVGCNSERVFAACRFQRGYELFLKNHPDVPWLYVCDDDTWFNIDYLMLYMERLMSFTDPMEHIIVKGHANKEKTKRYFLHGGTGWLMSNGFLDFCITNNVNLNDYLPYSRYRQPDTSQSIILRQVFPEISDWDEMYIQGYECKECNVQPTDDWYKSFPKCPEDPNIKYGRIKDIIAFHTIGLNNNKVLSDKIKTSPNFMLYYRDTPHQSIVLCQGNGKQDVLTYTVDSLKTRTKLLTPKDIKLPLCDFRELPDECCTGD